VATGGAAVYLRVLDELVPDAGHVVDRCANDSVEADHGSSRLGGVRSED
jgi:hypothetical protein